MSMEMSPRLSFSSDLPPSPASRLDHSLPLDPSSDEFDFMISTSFEASFDEYSTPADLLFSQGKLLPLHKSEPPPPPRITKPKDRTLKQILLENQDDESNTQQPFRYSIMARSSSVSARSSNKEAKSGEGTTMSICPYFPRSKSTGCKPDRSLHPTKSRNSWDIARAGSKSSSSSSSSNYNAKAYYYSGDCRRVSTSYGNGVRISPVINVPAPFVTRGGGSSNGSNSGGVSTSSFFAYLLCNCRDKDHGRE